jgi:hypothetical protein
MQNKANLVRKEKVAAYLIKKKKRIYTKKIMYGCRKNIADGRIRHKGRFINKPQAVGLLGLSESQNYDS